VSDFVEQCRREWKRLGVPPAVADDMATELAADLEEAAADGVSAEELLGSGASDPRSFAASWAAERGVVPAERRRDRLPGRSRVLVTIAVLLSVAAIAAGAAILASPTVRSSALPPPQVSNGVVWTADQATPSTSALPPPRAARSTSTVFVSRDGITIRVDPNPNASGDNRQTIAWSLLIAGLVAFVLSSLYWLTAGAQLSRRTS
jgi:hypothetical protein